MSSGLFQHQSYAQEFFQKSLHEITENDISAFINKKIEENLTLEYKGIATLKTPGDIGKEISAFANSSGGLLIVGLREQKVDGGRSKIAVGVEWNTEKIYNKEWFSQVMVGNIQPHVNNIDLVSVPSKDGAGNIFIVDVPASAFSPHMSCCDDHTYYERIGARSVPMEHYQVDYHFGRRLRPDLIPQIFIENGSEGIPAIKIIFKVKNDGRALAKWPMFKAELYGCQIDGKYIRPRVTQKFVEYNCSHRTPFIQFITSEIAIYPNSGLDLFEVCPIASEDRVVIKVNIGGENVVTNRYFGCIYVPGMLEQIKTSHKPIEIQMFPEERLSDIVEYIFKIAPPITDDDVMKGGKKVERGFVWRIYSAIFPDKSDEELDRLVEPLFKKNGGDSSNEPSSNTSGNEST